MKFDKKQLQIDSKFSEFIKSYQINTIIQAGSIVVKSIPKYVICGGNPAQAFAQRDIENYERLKIEEKFY